MRHISMFTFLLSIVNLLGLPSIVFAQSTALHTEKQYINPQTIKVTQSGIFIMKSGHLMRVQSLFTDKIGRIYIKGHRSGGHRDSDKKRDDNDKPSLTDYIDAQQRGYENRNGW